jgi:hypothetical protein
MSWCRHRYASRSAGVAAHGSPGVRAVGCCPGGQTIPITRTVSGLTVSPGSTSAKVGVMRVSCSGTPTARASGLPVAGPPVSGPPVCRASPQPSRSSSTYEIHARWPAAVSSSQAVCAARNRSRSFRSIGSRVGQAARSTGRLRNGPEVSTRPSQLRCCSAPSGARRRLWCRTGNRTPLSM